MTYPYKKPKSSSSSTGRRDNHQPAQHQLSVGTPSQLSFSRHDLSVSSVASEHRKVSAAMDTKVSAKIRTLSDYHHRLQHNQQIPSGLEVVNTLRYFQQTLLGFLKDVQNVAPEAFRYAASDLRSNLFPNLNYTGLYYGVVSLIEVYHMVPSGQIALGHSIVATLKSLYLFLDRDTIDQMPFTVASTLCAFPKEIHHEVMQLLCDTLLPFTLLDEKNDTYATLSVPAVVMLVFQHSPEPTHHTWLLETLMALKRDVYKDVLAVIACGTSESRVPSANLLFHYWPLLNPQILDRKPVQYKLHAWTPSRCQHKDCNASGASASNTIGQSSLCPSGSRPGIAAMALPTSPMPLPTVMTTVDDGSGRGPSLAIKRCYDPVVCAEMAETAPPIALCKQCTERVTEDYNKLPMFYVTQPMPTSNVNLCQNRGCQSSSRFAMSTCFSEDCIRAHQHVPIRLCQECHEAFHGGADGDGNAKVEEEENACASVRPNHIYHTRLPSLWTTDMRTFRHTVIGIVKLLKETSCQLESGEQEGKRPKWLRQLEAGKLVGQEKDDFADEKRMLSRYGIWLLAGLGTPSDDAAPEAIGYLMSMLFQWFATTALLPNDPMGSALEQLKTEFVCDWITSAMATSASIFDECLMPRPPEYARVGGMWEKLSTRTDQIKEGLSKILALLPYDVISYETWNKIMPEWLEAICCDVPEKDVSEFRVLLCKIFEPDLCPLNVHVDDMYKFVGDRFTHGDKTDILRALDWLHLLSEMEIVLPFELLLSFIASAARRLTAIDQMPPAPVTETPRQAPPPPPPIHPIIISRIDSIGGYDGLLGDDDQGMPTTSALGGAAALSPEDSPIRKPMHPATMLENDDGQPDESNTALYATAVDVIMRQMVLSDMEKHTGTATESTQRLLLSLVEILKAPWKGQHCCDQPDVDEFVDCNVCQETAIFHQLLMEVVRVVCPAQELRITMMSQPDDDNYDLDEQSSSSPVVIAESAGDAATPLVAASATRLTLPEDASRRRAGEVVINIPEDDLTAAEGVAADGDVAESTIAFETQLSTADVHVEDEAVEFVGMLPAEEVEAAMAQTVTLTETDVGAAQCQVTRTTVEDQTGGPSSILSPFGAPAIGATTAMRFWYTSQGKFRFALDELPAQLQTIYALLIDVESNPNPDALYFLLHTLKYLCLNAEALNSARREHRGFLIWAQENLLIPKLWRLLRADYSQLAEMCVPLILHCLMLPSGEDMFWKVVNDDFTSDKWTVRFAAVEKAVLLGQFLVGPMSLRGNRTLQGALANAFSHLIASVHDPNSAVASKVLIYLESIKPTSLKALCACLESQFDAVIVDRALILHRLSVLVDLLPSTAILSWEFFLQRFDVLTLESQLQAAARTGSNAMAMDLMHTDPMSDVYQRKVSRARQVLETMMTSRSIVRSMGVNALAHQNTARFGRNIQKKEENAGVTRQGSERRKTSDRHRADRQSYGSAAAASARLKLRKVVLMMKVLKAWQGFRRKIGSLSAVSLASTVSTMFGTVAGVASSGQSVSAGVSFSASSSSVMSSSGESASQTTSPSSSSPVESRASNAAAALPTSHTAECVDPKETHGSRRSRLDADGMYNAGKMREFTDEESNFCLTLNKVLDLESTERHTLSLTMMLFTKFLAAKKTSMINPDEKSAAKKQSLVLRHLNVMLGYSNMERCFTVPPQRLRVSAAVNGFLSGLPQIFDTNLTTGVQLLPVAAQLLLYLPSPQKLASDNQLPEYSLWRLEQHQRYSWLWSLLLILYKYRFNQPPVDDSVVSLVKIVIETLEAQVHRCGPTLDLEADSPIFDSSGISEEEEEDDEASDESTSAWNKWEKVRRAFARVRLMVRVMKMWPRDTVATKQQHETLRKRLSATSQLSHRSHASVNTGDESYSSSGGSDGEMSESEESSVSRLQPTGSGRRKDRRRHQGGRHGRHGSGHRKGDRQRKGDHPLVANASSASFGDDNHKTPGSPSASFSERHGRLRAGKSAPILVASDERVVEHRIKEQIDAFDRSFDHRAASSLSVMSPPMEVPMVVVTGECVETGAELVRPESLQITSHMVDTTMQHIGPTEQAAVVVHISAQPDDEVSFPQPIEVQPTIVEPASEMHSDTQSVSSLTMVPAIYLESINEEDETGQVNVGDSSKPRKTAVRSVLETSQAGRRRQRMTGGRSDTMKSAADGYSGKASLERTSSYRFRPGETSLVLRCTQCNHPMENYDEDTLCLAVVCLSTFVHREPGMCAAHLPRMIKAVARVANHVFHPWQDDNAVFVPGNARSVARQFLRVTLHQLAPNGIFLQLFDSKIEDAFDFFKTIVSALQDFTELNPVAVIQYLLEDLNVNYETTRISRVLYNLAAHISFVPTDAYLPTWSTTVAPLLEGFLRRYLQEPTAADLKNDLQCMINIIIRVLHVQNINQWKSAVGLQECFGKWMSQSLQAVPIPLIDLLNLCTASNRAFIRDRDRLTLSRACVNELLQAIKFKCQLPEENYMRLLLLILQDAGETFDTELDDHLYNTAVTDCARPAIQEFVDFISDLHVLNKIKNRGREIGFKEDTLGGDLKAGLAQYVAVEISRASSRDPRTVLRYLPWLLTPPSITQQAASEFVDCVTHVRVVSWVLLGALQSTGTSNCLPIPIESSQHIADQIQFVLAGFAEQSKESVIHMSALFHAFHLCQLWTVYCETAAQTSTDGDMEMRIQALATIADFWARVTPAILQLLSHSKVLADMVNLHFLNTIEALQERQSAVLCQLYPMWQPILTAYHEQLPSQLAVRLDACENNVRCVEQKHLTEWLKRVRFKISQVELQTSAALPFYNVT